MDFDLPGDPVLFQTEDLEMKLQESAEMYLETIYILQQRNGYVRSVDIANEMGFSKPTITEWMGKLTDNGYVRKSDDGKIELTDLGEVTAAKIYERHTVLTNVFESLGISKENARTDACRVEPHSARGPSRRSGHYEDRVRVGNGLCG